MDGVANDIGDVRKDALARDARGQLDVERDFERRCGSNAYAVTSESEAISQPLVPAGSNHGCYAVATERCAARDSGYLALVDVLLAARLPRV